MKKSLAILGAAAAITAFAVPAMADTTLYGSARMATFWSQVDGKAGAVDTNGFDEHLQANSRFGANFSDGSLGGKFELGLRDTNTTINNSTTTALSYLRLAYGKYAFSSGTLLVGQDYNNYYMFPGQVHNDDNANNNLGNLWDNRQAQIKFTMTNGLYVAAIQPTGNATAASTTYNTGVALDLYGPKLNVGFANKAGNFNYNVGVVGQMFRDNTNHKTVSAGVGYIQGKAAFGGTGLLFNLAAGQNGANMGLANLGTCGKTAAAGQNGQHGIENAIGYEALLEFSQKMGDSLKLQVGGGYVSGKRDGDLNTDGAYSAYVNFPITLAKNVTITPEVSYYDYLKNAAGTHEAQALHVGAQWRIDF